ncbi:MAG TPA: glycoside hydrolase family 30 beta sandwich domain-containing protein [Edaphobacter sp.]|nr:glycoside hydrolase family 30 beta sandwich domain-containing protein [Edaphobacter sp.]
MKRRHLSSCAALAIACSPVCLSAQQVSSWLTTPDRSALLQKQPESLSFSQAGSTSQVIEVDDRQKYQTMDGFGFALTGGSAQLIAHMDAEPRAALIKNLFSIAGDGIGVSYLRVSVGSSDMNDHVYSYDDLPQGQTDVNMDKFSLAPDQADVIPVLKQILTINPKVKILASPWSAPLWMKTTGVARGGVLKPEYFDAYALYWVKYLQGMKAEGINIDAITIQNEPLNEKNTPSMLMLESEQADFIANHLGPAFKKAGIRTKIVLYDHNLDHPAYPLAILKDKKANKYIDGTGFHLYGGTVDAFDQVHNAFPKKNLYFTEQSVTQRPDATGMHIAQPVARIVIGATRHWSRNVLLWNLAADPQAGPHTSSGGCAGCYGALTIDGNNVARLVAYYTIAHASKFVPDGSVRIESEPSNALPNSAFETPDRKTVLLVANTATTQADFAVKFHGKTFKTSLPAGAVGTYVW